MLNDGTTREYTESCIHFLNRNNSLIADYDLSFNMYNLNRVKNLRGKIKKPPASL